MTPRQRLAVFGIAGFFALLGIGAFGFVVWRTFEEARQGATAPPAEDRKLVVTAEALRPFIDAEIDPSRETFASTRTPFDGSHMVEYEYSSPLDQPSEDRVYLMSNLQVSALSMSAMQIFKMQQLAIRGGLSMAGETETVPKPELLTAGDAHYSAMIRRKGSGEPVGNLFIVRQGRVVHTVILVGRYLDNAADVERLLGPSLHEAKSRYVKR